MDVACYSMLEADLENHQAQLSRFQRQVTSVTEDILSMESKLNSTIMTLKKTLVSETGTFSLAWLTFSQFPFVLFVGERPVRQVTSEK